MEKFLTWAREHPVLLGLSVFGVGLLLLWWFGFFGSSAAASSGSSTTADYYAAEAAAQTAATQQEGQRVQAATDVAAINAQQDISNKQTAAQRDIALAQIAAGQEVSDTSSGNQLQAIKLQADYLTAAAADNVTVATSSNLSAQNIAAINAHAAESIAGINAGATENVAATNAGRDVQIAGIDANGAIVMNAQNVGAATQEATLAALTQQQEQSIAGQVAYHALDTNYLTAVQTAQAAAGTAQRQAELDTIARVTATGAAAGADVHDILNVAEFYANTRGSGAPGVPYP